VQSNPRLGTILAQFSSTTPAPSNSGIWTLDSLFLLPKTRLRYYLKLYNRLLKNTDNRLLIGAVDTLNSLMDTLESRSTLRVGDLTPVTTTAAPVETEDEVVIDMRHQTLSPPVPPAILRPVEQDSKTGSETSSNHGSASAGYVDDAFLFLIKPLIFFLESVPLGNLNQHPSVEPPLKRLRCPFQILSGDLPQNVLLIYLL